MMKQIILFAFAIGWITTHASTSAISQTLVAPPDIQTGDLDSTLQQQRERTEESVNSLGQLLDGVSVSKPYMQDNPPRVYLKTVGGYPDQEIADLRSRIESLEINGRKLIVPSISKFESGPSQNELRYFRADEKGEAESLSRLLGIFLPKLVVEDMSAPYEASNLIRPRHYEVWTTHVSNRTDISYNEGSAPPLALRWTTRTLAECGSRYYTWEIAGDRMTFRDQSGQVDIEQITGRISNGMLTQTLASDHTAGSPSEAIGTRWEYRYTTTDHYETNSVIRVQNQHGGRVFFLTKC